METFDVKCKFQELTVSGGATPSVTIPGRLRLCSIFYTRAAPNAGQGNRQDLKFYNGSSSAGTLMYQHIDSLSFFGQSNPCLTFPDDGLLFDDGLFLEGPNGAIAAQRWFGCITIIYSGG